MKKDYVYQDNHDVFNIDFRRRKPTEVYEGKLFLHKYPSEPDLSRYGTILDKRRERDRLSPSLFHEYTSVDDLGYYRRKKPKDTHTRSNIDFCNQSEPSIPLSLLSEYEYSFKDPGVSPRRTLIRRSTSLKLVGDVNHLTEQRSSYIQYNEDDFNRSSKIKYPDNLSITGEIEFLPEYKSAYKPFEFIMNPDISESIIIEKKKPSKKYFQQHCNLKLEGEQFLNPEYKSKFVEHSHIEKSCSVPQLSHIKFNGNFNGLAEYRDSYRTYNHYPKSLPIKKNDNLNLGKCTTVVPEYRERYKGYNRQDVQRVLPIIRNNSLDLSGEFCKELPEYYESFKDHHITSVPEKAKCRKPYLNLSGSTEYCPEYKSTYVDFPRSRPITKKPHSSIRFIPSNNYDDINEFDQQRPSKKQYEQNKSLKDNIHDPNTEELSSLCQPPEVRRAQMELLKREKSFKQKRDIFQKINELPKQISLDDPPVSPTTIGVTTTDTEREYTSSNEDKMKSRRRIGSNPGFKLLVENVDDSKGSFKKKPSARFGRRAVQLHDQNDAVNNNQIQLRESHEIRNNTRVIEGNREYSMETDRRNINKEHLNVSPPSFVILDDQNPIKNSNKWMKDKAWYDR